MERIQYDQFPDPHEATREELNALAIHLLAENKRLTHFLERILSSSSMPGGVNNELVQHIGRLAKEALREDEKE